MPSLRHAARPLLDRDTHERAPIAQRLLTPPFGAGEIAAGYLICEEIGRGGMGIVYRARQLSLDRSVAIRVLPRELTSSPELLARFEREASVGRRFMSGLAS